MGTRLKLPKIFNYWSDSEYSLILLKSWILTMLKLKYYGGHWAYVGQ